MIRPCHNNDFETIHTIINTAATAYKNIIPADRWHEPYMPKTELQHEIDAGVIFWAYERSGQLLGVAGIQDVQDNVMNDVINAVVNAVINVTLIRHAYVLPAFQQQGIGSQLLTALRQQTTRPLLVGTWAAATWAIRFYEKHGFKLVSPKEKDRLLKTYWSIPERQIETSVVLADNFWFERGQKQP